MQYRGGCLESLSIDSRGYELVTHKYMLANKDLLTTHYSDHSKNGLFSEVIRYTKSISMVPMVGERLNDVNCN